MTDQEKIVHLEERNRRLSEALFNVLDGVIEFIDFLEKTGLPIGPEAKKKFQQIRATQVRLKG